MALILSRAGEPHGDRVSGAGSRLRAFVAASAFGIASVFAQSNIDPAHSIITDDAVGALNWLPFEQHGAVINQFYSSGYIYGANVGWISLGSAPADRFQYRNNSAGDFGVNVTPDGSLRGFAYGANIGWINFDPSGNARVDWITGRLSGRAWSANIGWIDLNNATEFLRLESLPQPADSDSDGIPDAWEIHHAFDLTTFSASSDTDSDGLGDADEYLAGTNPLNGSDFLDLAVSAAETSIALKWPTKSGYLYYIDQRSALHPSSEWAAASPQVIGSGSVTTLSLPASNDFSFYRIRAYPPLSAP